VMVKNQAVAFRKDCFLSPSDLNFFTQLPLSELIHDLQVAFNIVVNLENGLNDKKLIDEIKTVVKMAKKEGITDTTEPHLRRSQRLPHLAIYVLIAFSNAHNSHDRLVVFDGGDADITSDCEHYASESIEAPSSSVRLLSRG